MIAAILFHDVVYDLAASPKANETNSYIQFAMTKNRCFSFGVDSFYVDTLIMATIHDGEETSVLGQLIADIDLATFGDSTIFKAANTNVRREYEARFPADQVRMGRKKFLMDFGAKPFIFYHDDIPLFNNQTAKANIVDAIVELNQL
jgi:predicted metal-dependent HD superfamily phosphohydrolase